MTSIHKSKFETLFDTYGAMLYGIALEISPSVKQAEEILIITYQKAHQQNIAAQKYPLQCVCLIRLLIQTAHQHLNNSIGKTNFKLKRFKNYPILHSLLCEGAIPESNEQKNTGRSETTGEKLRAEFLLMRYVNSKQEQPTRQKNAAALVSND